MKRLVIIGLIICSSMTSLVSCSSTKEEVEIGKLTKESPVKKENTKELSVEEAKDYFNSFIKSDLIEREKYILFDKRLKAVENIYDNMGIEYREVIGEGYVEGMIITPNNTTHLKTSNLEFRFQKDVEGDEVEGSYSVLYATFGLNPDIAKAYVNGEEMLDIGQNEFAKVFQASVERELDTEKLNQVISDVYRKNVGKNGTVCLDSNLNELFIDINQSKCFMKMSVSEYNISIELNIPLNERIIEPEKEIGVLSGTVDKTELAEKWFNEFIKSNLSNEEKIEFYNRKLEEIKAIYDLEGIKYYNTDIEDKDTGIVYNIAMEQAITGNVENEGHLAIDYHTFYLYKSQPDNEAHYVDFVIHYKIDEARKEQYMLGNEVLDINDTIIPSLYKVYTGVELDAKKFNELLANLYQRKVGLDGTGSFDENLDIMYIKYHTGPSFMDVSVEDDLLNVQIKFPLREKL